MLRIAFLLVIILHGLIHFMGFAKAFGLAELEQLTLPISRSKGIWWLLAAIFILVSAALFFIRNSWWWLPGIVGVIVSQVLIILYWQDAKWGTIPNVLLLAVAISGWGGWAFQRSVRTDLSSFWGPADQAVNHAKMAALPAPVRQWMAVAGVTDQQTLQNVQIWQQGKMRTTPNGKWMAFETRQWFGVRQPAFLWYAQVGGNSPMQLSGKDKLLNGQGHMLIKLFSLLSIVDAKGPEIDQGTQVRYLAEIIWFPAVALEDFIQWEALDEARAKAKLRAGNQSVDGIFFFNSDGKVIAFEADRHYQRDGESTLETWHIDIDAESYRSFRGISVPTRAKVSWLLKEGAFTWLELEIVNLE
ncbi:MAG: DUF6544 family protein [Saprospiraceae bacterium]